jgi:integrase
MPGDPVPARLIFTTPRRGATNRTTFDKELAAGAPQGRHRAHPGHRNAHFYTSALLDAGESIKALAEYLGHSDPAFTLRVYTHLMPSSEKRARRAIDDLFETSGEGPDVLGTS